MGVPESCCGPGDRPLWSESAEWYRMFVMSNVMVLTPCLLQLHKSTECLEADVNNYKSGAWQCRSRFSSANQNYNILISENMFDCKRTEKLVLRVESIGTQRT